MYTVQAKGRENSDPEACTQADGQKVGLELK